MAVIANGLGFSQVVESYREKGIILKETKRKRAYIGLEDPENLEEDVNSMVVDPKNGLAVGRVGRKARAGPGPRLEIMDKGS